jgi:sterol desaturase/sphingolipid hydroxylase (fatty acid hydroxylase superfamily)
MEYVLAFLGWTLIIYCMHRIVHTVPYLKKIHWHHHKHVIHGTGSYKWEWTNLFLWVDDLKGTLDQWIMEVIPTILFCWLTGHWWILILYWVDSAFIQEHIEHNRKFDIYPFLTSGKWHMVHHEDHRYNYGIYFPIWDLIFGTAKLHKK